MFPKRSKYLKKTIGWDDLGVSLKTDTHKYCGEPVSIGREKGKLFIFCNRCMIKLSGIPNEEYTELLEYCSDLEHERWSSWQKWVHQCSIKNDDGSLTIPKKKVDRWKRQIDTSYKDLTEKEKESDRHQVTPYLDYILNKIL